MTIASGAALSIYGAGGSDTIRFSSGSTGAQVFIAGGDGGDLLGSTAATFGYSGSTLSGGAGADTLTLGAMFTGATGVGNLVLGGAGADSITLVTAAGSYNGSINGGAGNDTINLLSGSLAAASGGLTTINGGSGTDVIQFRLLRWYPDPYQRPLVTSRAKPLTTPPSFTNLATSSSTPTPPSAPPVLPGPVVVARFWLSQYHCHHLCCCQRCKLFGTECGFHLRLLRWNGHLLLHQRQHQIGYLQLRCYR